MLAAPHQFSVTEYHAMVEQGLIPPDARVELIEGIIVDMAPIGPFHVGVTAQLSRHFTLAGPDKWLVMTQMPVRLDDGTELQPDIMLVPLDFAEFKRRTVTAVDVRLLIEVSDTSVRYDRERKIPLYASAKIPEVWIVNLDDHFVEVYRTPVGSRYSQVQQMRPGEFAIPQAFPDVRVNVAQLLERKGK